MRHWSDKRYETNFGGGEQCTEWGTYADRDGYVLCLWTCPSLRALALVLLVEAVDSTVWSAEASVGVRNLLHAGDLA